LRHVHRGLSTGQTLKPNEGSSRALTILGSAEVQFALADTSAKRRILPSTTQYWTHPSIFAIGRESDPIQFITESARDLVFRAIESGWQGPPFDPFQLANFAGIKVLPSEDVADARTVPTSGGRFVIEFNPNRPRHRIKYSICHEIAHTFFPDCSERIRNRISAQEMSGNDWQLEMLCNMGAAELLMPIGSFQSPEKRRLTIDQVLALRKTAHGKLLDMSMEIVYSISSVEFF